jgi:hypothetical protein
MAEQQTERQTYEEYCQGKAEIGEEPFTLEQWREAERAFAATLGEPAHLPEPWEVEHMGGETWVAIAPGGKFGKSLVLSEVGPYEGEQMKRAVACVNACAGLADPADAILEARAALKRLKHRFEANPGGDQLGQADAEAIGEALRKLGGA